MNIFQQVINHYGEIAQKEKAIEELRELEHEIWEEMDKHDYDYSKMLSEMADVYNMLEQLRIIYGFSRSDVYKERNRKMQRTMERIGK